MQWRNGDVRKQGKREIKSGRIAATHPGFGRKSKTLIEKNRCCKRRTTDFWRKLSFIPAHSASTTAKPDLHPE